MGDNSSPVMLGVGMVCFFRHRWECMDSRGVLGKAGGVVERVCVIERCIHCGRGRVRLLRSSGKLPYGISFLTGNRVNGV